MIVRRNLWLIIVPALLIGAAAPLSAQVVAGETPAHEPYSAQLIVRVLFAEGASELSDEGRAQLDAVIERITRQAGDRVQVLGFAAGDRELTSANRRLSLDRALAVRQHLMTRGVPAPRIDVRALGTTTISKAGLDRVDVVLGVAAVSERREKRK